MALYLGRDQVIINLDGVEYYLNLYSPLSTIEDILLSSSDDCLLKDFNGLYLIPKDGA